jgi:SAM-dependent methyltransferase
LDGVDPASIPVEQTLAFLLDVLPRPPTRVLDVGCGPGAILRRLLDNGYDVVGVDDDEHAVREATEQGLPVVRADWLEFEDTPYDALFFGRSLHHMVPLVEAVAHAHEIMDGNGLLVAEEFAVEAMDRGTATWFYGLDSVLQTAGRLDPDPHARPDFADPLRRWGAEHDTEPPLNTGTAMTMAVGRWFEIDRIERAPYLYRDFCARLARSEVGVRIGRQVMEMEIAGLAGGNLQPIGLRIVAQGKVRQNRADRRRRT